MGDAEAARVAHNDAAFREANEQVRTTALAVGFTADVPFLCECATETCTTIVRLPLSEYARIRSNPRHFVHAQGHVEPDEEHSRVIEDHGAWLIVEKVGEAGEIAEELDAQASEPGLDAA